VSGHTLEVMRPMTDRQKIVALAEVMGWKVGAVRQAVIALYGIDGRAYYWPTTWNPLKIISDAWMLVEKLTEIGWASDIAIRPFEEKPDLRFVCHGYITHPPVRPSNFCGYGATAPRAICEAVLDMVEGRV
jgi:hypothetical protein